MKLFLLIALYFLSSMASGHEVRPAFLKITELPNTGGSAIYDVSFRQPQIDGRYLGLALQTNCEETLVSTSVVSGVLIESYSIDCESNHLELIQIENLERTLTDTLVSITYVQGAAENYLINGDNPFLELGTEAATLPVYLLIGFEHLVFGYDHILFVILLLYLVQTPWAILKVVTSFTLAHSLTLGLSTLNLISLSQGAVEAVIAASIVLLAYEAMQRSGGSLTQKNPALIAFIFGLLHGMGFAGALAEIGLPEAGRVTALLLFNVGIELGQIAIIAVVIGMLIMARKKSPRWLYYFPVYMAGGVATYWFVERTWLVVS